MTPQIKQQIDESLGGLDEQALAKVVDYIQSLVSHRPAPEKRGKMRFDWAGKAAGIEPDLDSVTLQHRIADWR